jgi:large subunit ribosomal protein L25
MLMANFVLNAQAREAALQGKGASRRLRHAAQIPAIIYGGSAEPVTITLELRQIVKALENNAFFEEVIEIQIGDKVENVKIQALQRHPAKNTPMHADFKRA